MLTKSFGVDGVNGGFYFVLCSVLTFKKYLLHLIWYNSIQYALVSYQKVQRQLTKVSIKYKIAAAAKLLQSCPTLYDSIDGSPPGSPVPGILQARTLDWVAIAFSGIKLTESMKYTLLPHPPLLLPHGRPPPAVGPGKGL